MSISCLWPNRTIETTPCGQPSVMIQQPTLVEWFRKGEHHSPPKKQGLGNPPQCPSLLFVAKLFKEYRVLFDGAFCPHLSAS